MVEPIQGEAGIIIPDVDYMQNVKALCEQYNVLLICDEVQTGLGRTGKMFASEDIKPDMRVLGKALSGGMMPISCVLGSNEIMDLIEPEVTVLHMEVIHWQCLLHKRRLMLLFVKI